MKNHHFGLLKRYYTRSPPLRGGERLVAAFIDKIDTNASLTIIAT